MDEEIDEMQRIIEGRCILCKEVFPEDPGQDICLRCHTKKVFGSLEISEEILTSAIERTLDKFKT